MDGFVITSQGLNLIAKWGAGAARIIDDVWFGSGRLADDDDPRQLTGLIAPVATGTTSVPTTQDNQINIKLQYRNDMHPAQQGFWANEYGIFAIDPDIGRILLLYDNLGDAPVWIAPWSGGKLSTATFPVSIGVSGDGEITLNFPAGVLVTEEDVKEIIRNAMEPHNHATTRYGEGTEELYGHVKLTGDPENTEPGTALSPMGGQALIASIDMSGVETDLEEIKARVGPMNAPAMTAAANNTTSIMGYVKGIWERVRTNLTAAFDTAARDSVMRFTAARGTNIDNTATRLGVGTDAATNANTAGVTVFGRLRWIAQNIASFFTLLTTGNGARVNRTVQRGTVILQAGPGTARIINFDLPINPVIIDRANFEILHPDALFPFFGSIVAANVPTMSISFLNTTTLRFTLNVPPDVAIMARAVPWAVISYS